MRILLLFVVFWSTASSEEITENDKVACRELQVEYGRVCSGSSRGGEQEFCRAFENVCIKLMHKKDEEDEEATTSASSTKSRKRVDFTEFCRQFKNRYLYVCPDPFRFGQKAVVFCPIYSDRCHVSLPDKPVVPSRKPSQGSTVRQLCASYANFANSYCRNPILLAQAQYRASCEKYWRFCKPRR